MTKDLNSKAINIKGKKYVLVADRVIFFNETYPNGGIETSYVENGDRVSFQAVVVPDYSLPQRKFIGHSQAVWGDGHINRTSALENAETSAVGRALAFMGIGVIDSVASVDEINKAETTKAVPVKSGVDIAVVMAEVAQIYDLDELRKYYAKNKGLGAEVAKVITARSTELTQPVAAAEEEYIPVV